MVAIREFAVTREVVFLYLRAVFVELGEGVVNHSQCTAGQPCDKLTVLAQV